MSCSPWFPHHTLTDKLSWTESRCLECGGERGMGSPTLSWSAFTAGLYSCRLYDTDVREPHNGLCRAQYAL